MVNNEFIGGILAATK